MGILAAAIPMIASAMGQAQQSPNMMPEVIQNHQIIVPPTMNLGALVALANQGSELNGGQGYQLPSPLTPGAYPTQYYPGAGGAVSASVGGMGGDFTMILLLGAVLFFALRK